MTEDSEPLAQGAGKSGPDGAESEKLAGPALSCRRCLRPYEDEYGEDNEGSGYCPDCFEWALDSYEEHRRDRIARENEF